MNTFQNSIISENYQTNAILCCDALGLKLTLYHIQGSSWSLTVVRTDFSLQGN